MLKADTVNISVVGLTQVVMVDCIVKTGIKNSESFFFFSHLFLLEDSADWEKELQQELQEYEVVTESEKRDENWDKEIEKMLQEEN